MEDKLHPIGELLLNPCPFCGEIVYLSYTEDRTGHGTFVFVTCSDCQAHGPRMNSYELAKKFWNGDFKNKEPF